MRSGQLREIIAPLERIREELRIAREEYHQRAIRWESTTFWRAVIEDLEAAEEKAEETAWQEIAVQAARRLAEREGN
jgi:hypothetical protein